MLDNTVVVAVVVDVCDALAEFGSAEMACTAHKCTDDVVHGQTFQVDRCTSGISANLGNIPEIHVLRHCTTISVFYNLQSASYNTIPTIPTIYKLHSAICSLQSTIYNLYNLQAASCKLQSTNYNTYNLQPTIYILQSTICNLQSIYNLQSTIYNLQYSGRAA